LCPSQIGTAPRDSTLIWLHCRSEAELVISYWSKTFIGWEPITDQAVARAVDESPAGPWWWARRKPRVVQPGQLAAYA
jgi:hypothetical protein